MTIFPTYPQDNRVVIFSTFVNSFITHYYFFFYHYCTCIMDCHPS